MIINVTCFVIYGICIEEADLKRLSGLTRLDYFFASLKLVLFLNLGLFPN